MTNSLAKVLEGKFSTSSYESYKPNKLTFYTTSWHFADILSDISVGLR